MKMVEKSMGHSGSTFSTKLNKYGKTLFGNKFKGIFAKDRLPKLQPNQSCIFNLDKHNEPGSHWCGMYRTSSRYLIYDSFGRKVLQGKKYMYTEKDKEQTDKEENCGQRCLAWLIIAYKHGIDNAKLI